MNRNYLLTAATAFALGAGTTELADLSDAFAAPAKREFTVSREIPATNAQLAQIKTRIETAMCPEIEAKHGILSNECALEDGSVTSIVWGDPTRVTTAFDFDGIWTKGAAQ